MSAGRNEMKKSFSSNLPAPRVWERFIVRKTALVALLFALVLAGGVTRAEDGKANINPHNFADKSLCSSCHREGTAHLLLDPVTTCVKCHHGNVGNHPVTRHPIGSIPRIKIPSALPLSHEGQIVCYTCHDPHGKSRHPVMLRVEYLKLCASCHAGY